jgi:hypothetical protein
LSGDKFDVFPLKNKLYVYETTENSGTVTIRDIRLGNVIQSYSLGEQDQMFQGSDCFAAKGIKRIVESRAPDCSQMVKRESLTRGAAWIQAWPVSEQDVRITLGSHVVRDGMPFFYYLSAWMNPDQPLAVNSTGNDTRGGLLRSFAYLEKRATAEQSTQAFVQGVPYMIMFDFGSGTFTVWK